MLVARRVLAFFFFFSLNSSSRDILSGNHVKEREGERERRPGLIHFTDVGVLEIVLEEQGGH